MQLFDSHCHLDDEKFDLDRAEAIARMREAGVTRCTCVGSDLPSSRRCLDLAQQYVFIYAAAGVHPHEAKDAPADYLEQLKALIKENNLEDKVTLAGTFCTGNCQKGVCVKVDGELFSVSPETVNDFFAKEILAKVQG